MKTVSIIIPSYNEAATVLSVLGAIREQQVDGFEFEVLVVDDGSTDETPALMDANAGLVDRYIRLEKNQGKGAAVRAGLAAATGDYILFQDADLEYSPTEYAKILMPVQEFDADLVFGSRMSAPSCTRVAYFWHKVGNQFITNSFNLLYNTTFTDIYSCYLLLRRSLLNDVKLDVDGWAQQAEILGKVVKPSLRMYEVPIQYFGRTYEEGKKIRWTATFGVLRTMTSCRITQILRR